MQQSHHDEDAAQTRLKHYLYGIPARAMPPPPLASPDLSKDAAIVRHLQTELARAGFHGDGFGLVHRADASWTRERWDTAVRELDRARHAWQHANTLNRIGPLMEVGDALDLLSVSAAAEDSLA